MKVNNESKSFETLFNPETVAIIEAQDKISFFIEGFMRQGFNLKKIYLISTTKEEILGLKCYKSIEEIPTGTIDLLILAVRRELLIETLQDLLSKKKDPLFIWPVTVY